MEANNMKAMREALLLVKRLFDGRIMFQPAIRKAHEAVNAALSAPPHEAKWTAGCGYEFACCSKCGHMQYTGWDSRAEQAEKIGDLHELYKFCSNCGAQMKGETDGSK